MIHTVKCFGIVNKAEVDIFLEFSCFFYDPTDVGNLISGSSAFSKSNLNICKFLVPVRLKPCLENFEHYFASMWDECKRICLSMQETWFDSWVRKIPWRRKWQPTPVFLPRKSHGQRSLVKYVHGALSVGHILASKQKQQIQMPGIQKWVILGYFFLGVKNLLESS